MRVLQNFPSFGRQFESRKCKNCGAEILGIEIVHLNTVMHFKVQFVLPGLIFERICICQQRER